MMNTMMHRIDSTSASGWRHSGTCPVEKNRFIFGDVLRAGNRSGRQINHAVNVVKPFKGK